MRIPGKKTKELSEDLQTMDAGLAMAADLIADNAAKSLREGRWADLVADLAEASRRTQISLHEAVEKALAEGETFETLANGSHLSPEYLQAAYEQFNREMWAQAGPDKDGREPWRVLG
ncbi:hypothetical protein ACFOSC_27815 [Streptantibioticus rubrisoli]|uniref:Uncharacterized protein n=1 Tax=Streptantibioticus rubrisoli TaxID=1387313 RepID=A0ABT1PNB7_9ACTN|nr:hypothetical protein [Streptantibioticus rubrisoli]MCQ4045780.1 hypothetical protein [Streptantibioticus rubrisoli]